MWNLLGPVGTVLFNPSNTVGGCEEQDSHVNGINKTLKFKGIFNEQ